MFARLSPLLLLLLLASPSLAQIILPGVVGSNSAGIGIAIDDSEGFIKILKVVPNSPAAESKQIAEKQRILAIGQEEEPAVSTENKKMLDCIGLIRGAAGTRVRLTVIPEGAPEHRTREVLLTRDELGNPLGLAPDGTLLEVGKPAPALPITTLADGNKTSLEELIRGKVAVIRFWASWSTPSLEAMEELQKAAASFQSKNDKLVFISVCIDDAPDAVQKSGALVKAKEWPLVHHVWASLPDHANWHILALPMTYIIDAQGHILQADPPDLLEKVLPPLLTR